MLTELRIENFAIIQRLELSFKPGLTTFTGETGAGKSIILDAIVALLGGRVDQTDLRSGADRALVEGTFNLPDTARQAIQKILETEDLLDDPNLITLGRELRREGRTVCRVNGRSVNAALLREIGAYLVDIHGQSDHLSLLNAHQHLGLLDRFALAENQLSVYHQTYQKLQELRRQLKSLRLIEQDAARMTDLLSYQVNEIEAAQLKPGEEEDLRQERDRLANAENLAALAQQGLVALEESTPETPSISDLMGQVTQALSALSRIDHSQEKMSEQARSMADLTTELSRDLRDYLEQIEYNPRRLEQVEERLAMIHNLEKKYGGSIEAVLIFCGEARQKLDSISHAEESIVAFEADEQKALQQLSTQAQELSRLRRKSAEDLNLAIEGELAELSMNGARFTVDFQQAEDPQGVEVDGKRIAFDGSGIDKVEFMIAPNPGEGFKPLVKTASGGETSRLMLALKNVLARADFIPTLIFDEIDQGIGGRVGMVVGEKLWQLARRHQVFCVTHLPQLAAFGDQHLGVRKQVHAGRTQTEVESLIDEVRLDELALMLGTLSENTRTAAREVLQKAHQKVIQLGDESNDQPGLTSG